MVKYIPNYGDIAWIDHDPQKGNEIGKTRPSLIISRSKYNAQSKFVLCMPITSKIKGYPFEVIIDAANINGAILCNQIRSFDWRARNTRFIEKASQSVIAEVMGKLMTILPDLKNIK